MREALSLTVRKREEKAMPKSSGFLAVFLACLLCFTPSFAHAKGVNSAENQHLPMGAGNHTFLYLTSTGRVHIGADVGAPFAWIDTNTGEAQFDGGVEFGNGATVKGFVDAIDGQNIGLKTALPIWATGFLVGPRAYFGRHEATSIGLWYLNENWTLDAGKSLVVKNNGWVGIGTVNPSSLLSVAGNAYASDGAKANTLTVRDAGSIDAARMDILTRLSALKCSEGQLLTKDTDKTFKCVTVAYNGTFNCPAGEALTGFVNGVPQCAKLVEPIGCRPVVDCVGREPEPGDMCQDGTVFVGYTPDGHVKMFATPCLGDDLWSGWDGCSKCSVHGNYMWWAPADYDYRDNHYYGSIGVQDKITGKANTSAIAALNKIPPLYGRQERYVDYDACAAAYCDAIVAYGHSDWYLPAAAEALLFGHKKVSFWDFYSLRSRDNKVPTYVPIWSSTEHPPPATSRALLYLYKIDSGYVSVNGQAKGMEYARCVRKEGCRKKIDCNAVEPSIGDMCLDGTVYAGLSPDGNVKMFTTPCDLGQTWDGCSTCVGTRTQVVWSNWQALTGINNQNSGKANSAALAAFNSPIYTAARTCENLVANGYNDWYLPAINELILLGNGSMSIGNFGYSWSGEDSMQNIYWSSSESMGSKYYSASSRASAMNPDVYSFSELYYNAPDVNGSDIPKTDTAYLRCVRR